MDLLIVDEEFRIAIPEEMLASLGLEPGAEVEFHLTDRGFEIVPVRSIEAAVAS